MGLKQSGDLTYSVFFRTSKAFGKSPIESVDSRLTYYSLLESFSPGEVICIADNASEEQRLFFAEKSISFYQTSKGNSGSFRLAIDLAPLHPVDIYYFVEDDHLHLPDQKSYLAAGLEYFDFISIYDHPDKYQGQFYPGLQRQVLATAASHFASSPSTVMTFACKAETLCRARATLLDPAFTGEALKVPRDHDMFVDLGKKGFSLGASIPGRSTHCERQWPSPFVDCSAYACSLATKYGIS